MGVFDISGPHGARRMTRMRPMQRVAFVRYTTKPHRADENEVLSRAVFDELRATAPDNMAYALFRDGNDFVHLFINVKDDDSSALTELPSFKAYVKGISERCTAEPEVIRASTRLVESYGLTRALVPA